MELLEMILVGIALAMDAFSVSICKGLSMRKRSFQKASMIASYFGVFQAIMPVIGYFLGSTLHEWMGNMEHWIVFILLTFIGVKMIHDAKKKEEQNDKLDIKTMLALATATSIDALAVGITFAFLEMNIWMTAFMIGIITFLLSFLGVLIGNLFGNKLGGKAEWMGGVLLIIMGVKNLIA